MRSRDATGLLNFLYLISLQLFLSFCCLVMQDTCHLDLDLLISSLDRIQAVTAIKCGSFISFTCSDLVPPLHSFFSSEVRDNECFINSKPASDLRFCFV
ncbi:hypothetical protein I7I50_03872 [Histoplasma capsulatum G186AR]|uniref:Uncharacterized protein n=1 Tax=Ajellomyces capsulatus TaxID=5037 RepID=A0A8H8CWS8_AJECA|nr:hypothetical protein I7I52_04780 [Histoplasma capsulatum]QSS74911.1 hypothetical protein I7I50_03872 [Histoplasma capsulatum G186AR]